MKNIFTMAAVCCIVIFLYKGFLAPTGVARGAWYTGMRDGTKIMLNIPVIEAVKELPRFPADVLIYSPLKLIDFVDVNVLDKEDFPPSYSFELKSPISERYSFAFCYLKMLREYRIDLPRKFKSKDINYDITPYFRGGDEEGFSLRTVKLDMMSDTALDTVMSAIGVQAARDTTKMTTPMENCIAKLTNGDRVRYVWVHYVSGGYVYVADPCAPQLSYARINVRSGVYRVGTDTFRLSAYYRKTAIPKDTQ